MCKARLLAWKICFARLLGWKICLGKAIGFGCISLLGFSVEKYASVGSLPTNRGIFLTQRDCSHDQEETVQVNSCATDESRWHRIRTASWLQDNAAPIFSTARQQTSCPTRGAMCAASALRGAGERSAGRGGQNTTAGQLDSWRQSRLHMCLRLINLGWLVLGCIEADLCKKLLWI